MRVHRSIEVEATPEVVFALTQNYDVRLDWDPFLKEARLLGGATQADLGVKAWCVTHNGFGMETRYISFRPPATCAIEMTRGPWFLRSFAGSWRFQSLSTDRTRVEFNYDLVARPEILTRVLLWTFDREMQQRLKALKRAIEGKTGPIRSHG